MSTAHGAVGGSELVVLQPGLLGHGSAKALPEGQCCWGERSMSERSIWDSPGLGQSRTRDEEERMHHSNRECKTRDELICKLSFPGSLKAFLT